VAYDGADILKIQVTRAERSTRVWETLNKKGSATNKYPTVDEAADALRDTIEAKGKNIKDKSQRAEILLALDATETASQVFELVVDSFCRRHGLWARQLGFRGIWVVGPTATLTTRLDNLGPTKVNSGRER